MLTSFISTVLGGHLWKGEKSIPSFKRNCICSRRYRLRHWEMPWYLFRPRGKAETLHQRLLKRAGYIQQVQKAGLTVMEREACKGRGSLSSPRAGWIQAWKQGHWYQERIICKHFYISADLTASRFSSPNLKIKLALWVWELCAFLWGGHYKKNISASLSQSSEVPPRKRQRRLVDCIISDLLHWVRNVAAGVFTFPCLWKENQNCFTEESLVITSHC